MKNKILLAATLAASALAFAGCQDRLQREFQNPEKHDPMADEIVPGMFTQMLTTRYFVQDYGEWYWNIGGGGGIPAYAQIAVRRPTPTEAGIWSDWSKLDGSGNFYADMEAAKRFNTYYTNLKSWALIRDEMETVSGREFDDNEMFYLAATVIKNSIGLQAVDIFDRIPYSEAFQGTKGIFFPKYDQAKDVYTTVLDDLADLAGRIPAAFDKMSATAKETFATQDLAFGGDARKWVQFANALRLRHAVRMSGVDEAFAKKHIVEAIANLPQADMLWPNTQRNENRLGGGGGGIYARALYEQAYATLIPNIVIQRMNLDGIEYVEGEDDPRLPVISTPSRYTAETPESYQFIGVSMDYDSQHPYWPTQTPPSGTAVDNGPGITFRTFATYPTNITAWLRNCYSHYNIATFTFGNIPSYMTSLAENDLFLAEVAAKGLASTGKSAADHVRDAVVNSTDMWYYVNSLTNIWATEGVPAKDNFLTKAFQPAKPSADMIAKYADKVKAQMEAASGIEEQMEVIMQQKYIHHNILNVYELWAELRRTRHPRLEKLKSDNLVHAPIPERISYPTSEIQNNAASYNEVQKESNFITPIFWVTDAKKTESYYMNGYLPLKGFLPLPENPEENPNRMPEGFGTWKP